MNEENEGHMQQHMCSCHVDLGGEGLTTIFFDENNPVAWPEIKVLQSIHGDDAVYDIQPVALGPREPASREKMRMALKYGSEEVDKVYAGKSFLMEWFMPGWPIDPKSIKRKKKPDRPKPPTYRKPPADDEGAADARF